MKEQSIRYLVSHGRLLLRVVRNELAARYAASLLGLGWAALAPLLILGIYALIYVEIFKVRVPGLEPVNYALFIFSGLVPYLATAEAVAVGVSSVVADKALLSNTVFPIDLVPVKPVLNSQVTMAVGLTVIIIGLAATRSLHWTVVLVPLVWIGHAAALIGLNWVLSLLNIVVRDLQNLITAILMMLLVASPIAYTPEMVPPVLKPLITVNPFAYYVVSYQNLLVFGRLPSPFDVFMLVIISGGLLLIGSWFFPRAKRVLLDYI